ncbi:hypothetical protein GCM10028803_04260 [Larkinella knui]|uniref:histidine kinase n=1 Tax=Larkinella knui TaxID=2025310 RepID=A0A3P1CKN8_9BACT|nr:response regulator [Larkinella knui]RRB13892.1 hybrid sensor histidine kinase/response regulator [Larkinella knui]
MATKILYIEDETHIRENTADLLRLHEYAVTTAANGREGISQAMLSPPDLILCDIRMPHLDGYQVLDTIREYRPLATVPFIFLSAKTDEIDVRRGMALGADDYLKKPFTLDSLLLAVESRLQRETLREADLQARVEVLRQTMTRVSNHEYNTPLGGILGFASLMMAHYDEFDREESLSMLAMIKACSLRLKRSLDNLRLMETLQQVKPGQTEYTFFTNGASRIDPDRVQQQIHTLNDRLDASISCQPEVESANIALSDHNLGIILDELLDNAHKFSRGPHPIQITGRQAGLNYQLTIANQGLPFKAEDVARIAPFVQFDRHQYEQQGSGVGLAIVKKLLDLNHGLLSIDSLPAGETSVAIILPLAR